MQVTTAAITSPNVTRLLSSLRASSHFDIVTAKRILTLTESTQANVSEVYQVAKQKQSLDHDVVKLCLSYYSRYGNARSAQQLIERAKSDGVEQHDSWFSSLAGALAADGDIQSALHTLQKAKGSVDPQTIPSLVTKLTNRESSVRGYMKQFFKIIRDTVEKPQQVYVALLSQFAKAGDLEICNKLYAEMKKQEVDMGVPIYNALISAHKKKGDMPTCMMLFKEMKDSAIKPGLHTYNLMIDGFSHLEDMTSCQEMLEELQARGYKPNITTYNMLLSGYTSMGDLFMCNKIHKAMKEGITANLTTYKLLLRANETVGKVKECEALFNEMKSLGIQPDEACLETVQKALGEGDFRQRILVRGWLFAAFLPHLLGM